MKVPCCPKLFCTTDDLFPTITGVFSWFCDCSTQEAFVGVSDRVGAFVGVPDSVGAVVADPEYACCENR